MMKSYFKMMKLFYHLNKLKTLLYDLHQNVCFVVKMRLTKSVLIQ